ncbi:AcrR family transcriptional regulator [Arthrobacter sp. UYP6]|uniref:TetR family transcriptional regulator n=1 Tax=Arthrobacter sp. UYP6 TaxID=1756378 RepID=UPI003397B2C6
MTMNADVHRRSPLSAAAIAACGVALADSKGLEAVSMRHIADALGVSAMALYRHVENRENLLLAMAAETGREFVLLPPAPATWQEMLRHLASSLWDGFVKHPWLLQIVLGPRRLLDMASTSDLEVLLQALRAAGLTDDECFDCVLAIPALVIGTSSLAFAANPGPGVHSPTRANAVVPLNADDAARPESLTAAFRGRGITYDSSRKSLDFAVDGLLRGIEARSLKNVRMHQEKQSG